MDRYIWITGDGVIVTDMEGNKKTIPCEQTILAIGYRSRKTVFEECQFDYAHIYMLGDSKSVRNIKSAIWEGYEVARNI